MFIRKIATSKVTYYKLVNSIEGVFHKTQENAHLLGAVSKENLQVANETKQVLDMQCKKTPK